MCVCVNLTGAIQGISLSIKDFIDTRVTKKKKWAYVFFFFILDYVTYNGLQSLQQEARVVLAPLFS